MLERKRIVVLAISTGILALEAATTSGQDFPNKPVRIVTSPAGGGNDIIVRILAREMSGPLGQPVIVDNRPTVVATEVVSKAPPDGYSLLVTGFGFIIGGLLQKLPFDPVKDFAPISMVDISPNVLVVHPSLPVKSIKELIALAKARPGVLNYAYSGSGGSLHLGAELFKTMAGLDIVGIDYGGGAAAAMRGLVTGESQVAFAPGTTVAQYTKSGALRALAVTSLKPSELVPNLPTAAASGLPGFELLIYGSFVAPAGTPGPIIRRLNQELVRVLVRPDVKERFAGLGSEAAPSSPEEHGARIKSEITKWSKVIKDAGIKTGN